MVKAMENDGPSKLYQVKIGHIDSFEWSLLEHAAPR